MAQSTSLLHRYFWWLLLVVSALFAYIPFRKAFFHARLDSTVCYLQRYHALLLLTLRSTPGRW